MAKSKRNLTFTDEVWEQIQEESQRLGVSASAFLSMAAIDKISATKMIQTMAEAKKEIEKIGGLIK